MGAGTAKSATSAVVILPALPTPGVVAADAAAAAVELGVAAEAAPSPPPPALPPLALVPAASEGDDSGACNGAEDDWLTAVAIKRPLTTL